MLTEGLPACPTAPEEPVRDLAISSAEKNPSLVWTGSDSSGGRPVAELRSQRCFGEDVELKKDLALLLTEQEMRVLTSLEAQELSSTMEGLLQTLTVSAQTPAVSDVQLGDLPLLVFFTEEKTVRDAYRLLRSLLGSPKPVPKPRTKSCGHLGRRRCLMKALTRGIETGDATLTLQHSADTNTTPEVTRESNGSTRSGLSLAETGPSKAREDVRQSAYKRLDSLEETIRELENTLMEISGHSTAEQLYTGSPSTRRPGRTTDTPTPEAQKPPVPPKPSSFKPASIQVHCFHLLCPFLCCFISGRPWELSNVCFLLPGDVRSLLFTGADVCRPVRASTLGDFE